MNIMLHPGYTPSGRAVIWNDANNPHLYLSGQSGTGKSFLMKKLLTQAAEQGALVLALDYTCDFLHWSPPDGFHFQRIDVTSPSFTLNPLIGLPGQSPDTRAQQLLSALHAVFRMGPRATVSLRQATTAYLTATGRPTLTDLLDHISEIENAGRGLDAAREPLELLTSLVHCGNQPLGLNLNTSGLIVLDLAQIADQNLCKLLIELLLQAIWTAHTDNQPPLILVLDECQRLNWGASSMSIRILREGRKFGIGGWFSSQYLDHNEASAALGQAALQAHFRPDGRHIIKLAKHLSASRPADQPKYQQLIQGLHRGQFLWQQPDGKPVIVTVRD